MTVTQGPSVFARVDSSGQTPVTVSCAITDTSKSAVCEQKQTAGATGTISASAAFSTGVGANSANASIATTTLSFNQSQIHYNALVITKGAEKLSSSSIMATKTPVAPSSASNPASAPTKKSDAGLAVAAPSFAGLLAVVFAVFAL